MEVISCKRCGALFQYLAGPHICMKCRKLEEDTFQTVKAYLRDNRGANMQEVSEATGVSTALIQRFLREGRLEVLPGSLIILTCEKCGKKIYTGRFCEQCQAARVQGFAKAAKSIELEQQEVKVERERMRFLNRTR